MAGGTDVSRYMDAGGDTIARLLGPPLRSFERSIILRFLLGACWYLLHLLASIVHLWSHLIQVSMSYIVSSGLLKKYKKLQLQKLRYLAVVIDTEEAKNKARVQQLLGWLSDIGLKYVILYDMEGVLKKSMETDPKSVVNSITSCSDDDVRDGTADVRDGTLLHLGKMTIELLSISDGKEAVAKAASFLCSKHLNAEECNRTDLVLTETDMGNALKAVGYGGPEPDLLLVYGPARCHLGFPAWRLRYTEIVLAQWKHGGISRRGEQRTGSLEWH